MATKPLDKSVRIAQVISLAQEGLNGQQIADRLGLSFTRVSYLARLAGVALPGTTRDRAARVDRLQQLARDGLSSYEIGAQLGISAQHVRTLARRHEIVIVADTVNGVRRRLDSKRVVAKTIEQLDGIGLLFDQIDYRSLPREEIEQWISSLDEALHSLLYLRRRLKESQL